eukprot:5116808-Pyramimonas_sp.AAC.1
MLRTCFAFVSYLFRIYFAYGSLTFPTQALPRWFLLAGLKGARQCPSPRAVPPASAPRFPQLRPLSLALLISS